MDESQIYCGILKLPPELLDLIAFYLDRKDLYSLRLTHVIIKHGVSARFERRYFRKKGFMLTTSALTNLQSISEHPELRHAVQHVWLNPDFYTYLDLEKWHPKKASRFAAYETALKDHKALLTGDRLSKWLTQILGRMPNLTILGVRRGDNHSPHGWRKCKTATGLDPRSIGRVWPDAIPTYSTPTLILAAIFHAAQAGAISLTRLYTDTVQLKDYAVSEEAWSAMKPSFSRLKSLEISLGKSGGPLTHGGQLISRESRSRYNGNSAKFLDVLPQLSELSLQTFPEWLRRRPPDGRSPSRRNTSIARQTHENIRELRGRVALTCLTKIRLQDMEVTPLELSELLTPSRDCLKQVKVQRIWTSDDLEWKSARTWEPFLRFLSTCPKLESLLLYKLFDRRGPIAFPMPSVDQDETTNQDSFLVDRGPSNESHRRYTATIVLDLSNSELMKTKVHELVELHEYHQDHSNIIECVPETWYSDTSDDGDRSEGGSAEVETRRQYTRNQWIG